MIIAAALMINLLIVGCRNPVGEKESSGTTPEIDRVNFYYYDEADDAFYLTYYFYVGETAYVEIAVTDSERDIARLTTTTRLFGSTDAVTAAMGAQTADTMWYYTTMEVDGPVGDREVAFEITDATGNRSRELAKTVTVF